MSTASPAAPDPPGDAADGGDLPLVTAGDDGPVESVEVVVHDELGDPVAGPWSHRDPMLGNGVDDAAAVSTVEGSVA